MSILNGLSAVVSPGDFTKLRIANALAELLAEQSFEKLKIKEICERANISRKTFYAHFPSKYDIVQWFWEAVNGESVRRLGRDLKWRESLELGLTNTLCYADFFRAMCSDLGYDSCIEFGRRSRITHLKDTIETHLGHEIDADLEFQIAFYAHSEPTLIFDALKNGADESYAQTLARQLESCIPAELHQLIDESV